MVLQQAVLAAEMAFAEAAVSNNALSGVLAVLETAADLLGGHAGQSRRVDGLVSRRLRDLRRAQRREKEKRGCGSRLWFGAGSRGISSREETGRRNWWRRGNGPLFYEVCGEGKEEESVTGLVDIATRHGAGKQGPQGCHSTQ